MKDRTLVAAVVLALSLVAACADSGGSSASLRRETREITRDDGVTFVATIGDATFRTEYTATTTLHEVVVGGRTIVHHGTASEGWSRKASAALDSDGFAKRLDDDDRALLERALVMIDGASAPPSARDRARARFGAAYAVARVLGLVTTDPDRWPYPGFEDDADAPEELGLGASTGGSGGEGRQGPDPDAELRLLRTEELQLVRGRLTPLRGLVRRGRRVQRPLRQHEQPLRHGEHPPREHEQVPALERVVHPRCGRRECLLQRVPRGNCRLQVSSRSIAQEIAQFGQTSSTATKKDTTRNKNDDRS